MTTADLRDRTADAVLLLLRGGRGETSAEDHAEVAVRDDTGAWLLDGRRIERIAVAVG